MMIFSRKICVFLIFTTRIQQLDKPQKLHKNYLVLNIVTTIIDFFELIKLLENNLINFTYLFVD